MKHIEKFDLYTGSIDESEVILRFPTAGCVFVTNKVELEAVRDFLTSEGFYDLYRDHAKSIEKYIKRIDNLKTTILCVIWNGEKFYVAEFSDAQLKHGLDDGTILDFPNFMTYTYNWKDLK